ncbi:N-glycosylase/DNA lyase [Candidatus Babeliales bacterium]|nr:N-glycosylase/DNA lyase [Candidatus Babeliales bacterium]MCF7899115.1 N-glycosylase/DNA lyase [Candidatus Babeliales bacterium]
MKKLLEKILKNLDQNLKDQIEAQLKYFNELNKSDNLTWFSELCFCLLTANSKAQTAINIQTEINGIGFVKKTQTEIAYTIKKHGHRFHNIKTKYIFLAREFIEIKDIVKKIEKNIGIFEARNFLVSNIKGLGYKESSHFLRNVGYHDFAIIDRHILRFLHQNNFIKEIPKTITSKKYLEFENILKKFEIPLDRLDLILWAHMTGKVLK